MSNERKSWFKVKDNIYVVKTPAGWKSSYKEFLKDYASSDTREPHNIFPKNYPCVVVYDEGVFDHLHQTFLYNLDIKNMLNYIGWKDN